MDSTNFIVDSCKERVFGKEGRFYLMGVAITIIVFLHFYTWFKGTRPWWIYFFSEGQIGVDLFLFLSAFGLEASFKKNGWKRFYINRAKRILPVCILFLVTLFTIFQNDVPFQRIIIQFVGQLTGFSLFQPNEFFSTNFEFDWFTPALIIVYILFPILSGILNRLLKKSIIIEVLLLLFLIFISLVTLRFVHLPIKLLLYRAPIIMLGAVTYIHLKKGEVNRLLTMYAVLFITGLFSNQHWVLTSSTVPLFLTVYAMIQGNRPFYKLFTLFGRHSYEIYLAHIFPVTNFLMLKVFDNIYYHILLTILWTIIVASIYSLFQKYAMILFNNRLFKQ